MANYLDDLQTFLNRATVVRAALAVDLAAIIDSGVGDPLPIAKQIVWNAQLSNGSADTNQTEELRLRLLTLLVDNFYLNDVPDPAGIVNLYQPVVDGNVTPSPSQWGMISGDINNQTGLIAKFNQYLLLSGGTMTGPLLIAPTTRIDSTAALNIGTNTSTQVNIGRTGIPIQLQGTVTQGLWNGTNIGVLYGGLGTLSFAAGAVGQSVRKNGAGTGFEWFTPGTGSGDVAGPGDSISTDNAIVRWNGSGGRTIQNSTVLIGDAGEITGALSLGFNGATSGTVTISAPGAIGTRALTLQALSGAIALDANRLDFFAATTSAQLITKITDPQGTGRLVFNDSPTLITPTLGAAIGTSVTLTGAFTSGVASTSNGFLTLRNDTNNFTQSIRGSATSATRIFALPTADPTVGQVLTGSAPSGSTITLSWSSVLTNPMDNVGQLIYGGVAGAPTKLAADLTNTKKFLNTTSIAGVGQAPVWSVIGQGDLPTVPLNKGGTGVNLADPNANRFFFWDDTTTQTVFATLGAGLGYNVGTKTVYVDATSLVASVAGTADRITASPTTGNVIVDIAATYAGQASIDTVGTIGSGTWEGAVVDYTFGGTGLSALGTAGQVLATNAGATAMEWVTLGGGSGTVTSVSVVSANGFAGSVATATSTPAITLTTTITGIIKGNGTAISAAVAGTDYLTPFGYTAKTANYTILTTDTVINCTSNSFTLTFPTAVGISGKMFVVKNVGAGIITLAGNGGQTFDGVASPTIPTNTAFILFSDGSNWIIA